MFNLYKKKLKKKSKKISQDPPPIPTSGRESGEREGVGGWEDGKRRRLVFFRDKDVCVCVCCARGEKGGEKGAGEGGGRGGCREGGKRGSVKTVSRGLEYQLLVSART